MTCLARCTFVCLALMLVPACHAAGSEAGRLPLAYRTSNGAYPWTGRLFAIGWQDLTQAPSPDLWEAGDRLDRRTVPSRRIFTYAAPDGATARAMPLQWDAVTETLHMGDNASVDWLRGDQTRTGLRPRDTRLGNAAGARVRVVAPPAWSPGKPGHAGFRLRYSLRPHVAWHGTVDGLLHAFDAATGEERAAYLPGALLPYALAMPAPGTPTLPPPCPRPETQDVTLRGEWRTVLLCGIPAKAATGNPAAVFALDVTEPEGQMPFVPIWEIAATDALPLAARGPVRAAGIRGPDGLRWYAVVIIDASANGEAGVARAGLALLPLDKPAGAAWAGQYAIRTLPLAERDCLGGPAAGQLVAVSVLSDLTGAALAAYATDDAGQLWRFALADAPPTGAGPAAACLYRMQVAAQPVREEAPVLLGSPSAPVVIYGAGNELAAVPDELISRSVTARVPRQLTTQAADNGQILRATPGGAQDHGWRLTLPHAGEQLVEIEPVFPGYLLFVTRTPDGAQRSYLVLAATGESVAQRSSGERLLVATGQLLPPGASVFATRTEVPGTPAQPGGAGRQAFALSVWSATGNAVTQIAQTLATRRIGRLRWREIVGPAREEAP
ncbi:Putative type 4 fimbrial biogenesis Pily1-related protein transmembrane [Cupriavidus phytorum]|uniref:Type 4 fimbrial biogenesis Pily1-related protein transmembrane n=2 Tax=Cupriavidus TaxID=106589 RepID=A0A375C890_9BURK|nr:MULTISPECIES: pilus assembly protein PilY [Cupriavidus]PZX29498.1 type IV pilus assembly protein PilY1 [Cupriavidus alkaliphilus]SOY64469.1 Putative type 4 fimbrial biogenesis Pily1-related protein transmembrane [Cupriavidus taiwanensis]